VIHSGACAPSALTLLRAGMFLIWGLVVPASIFVARYVKSHPNWIVVHRALMTVVTSTTLPLLATALNANNAVVRTRHAVVGVVVGGCVLLNVFLGHASFVSLQAVANQKLSRFVRGLHATLGWALMAMSIYMLQSGAALLDPALEGYFWAWFALTVASFLFFDVLWMTELLACLGRFRCCRDLCGVAPPDDAAGPAEAAAVGALRKEPALRRSDQRLPTVLPLFTVEDLKREIFRGAKWLTIDDRVYNIEEFIGAHPGGAKVLESVLGKDIGRFFFGMQKLDMPGTVRHSHSRHAQRRLERMLVGLLTLNPAQSSLFPAAQALDLDIQEAARSTRNAERAARKPASVVDLAGKPELAPRRVRLVRRELLSDEPSGAVARLVFSEEDALGGDAGAGAGASAGAGAKPAASSPSALSATAAAAGAALSKPVIELVEIAEHKQQQQQQPAEQQLPQQPRQPSESGEAARAARVESADGLEMNPMHLQAVAEEEEDDGLFGLPRFVNSFGQNYRVSSVIKGERIHRFYSVVRTNLPLDAEDAAAAAATAAARAAAAGEEKRDASPRAGGGGGDAAAAAAAAAANGGGEARVVVQLSPLGERELALVVKRYPTGLMSRLLHALSPGETISLEGPRGIGVPFSVIDRCKHITLIAAGTGLLPFLDLVDVVCRRARAGRGRHRVPCLSVLCSFRSDRSIIGREWLEARAREAELCRDAFADVATPLPRGRSLQPQPQPHPQLPPAASPSAAPTRVDSLSDHGRGPERTNSASPSPQHSPRRLPTPQRAPQRSASSRDALPPALRVFITVQHPTRTWAGNVGYFDRKLLKRLVPRATDAIYVCGSEAFNNQVRDLLLRLGFAPDDVHTM
jgi:ferredoxin-NADP reductase